MLPDISITGTNSLGMAIQSVGRGLRMMTLPPPRRALGIAFFKFSKIWRIRFDRGITSVAEEQEIEQWCQNNCAGWYDIDQRGAAFEDKDDAMMCWLRYR